MSRPRQPYKMKTCEVCGREYRAYPEETRRSFVYRGTCGNCGTKDFSCGDSGRGHLEIEAHADTKDGFSRTSAVLERERKRSERRENEDDA